MKIFKYIWIMAAAALLPGSTHPYPDTDGKGLNKDSLWIASHYDKNEYRIAMRDGALLFTSVYTPKDHSKKYPVILYRTPYSVAPYGSGYKSSLGPDMKYAREGFIFVYQDVRGRFMSEGDYVNMCPHIDNKKNKKDVDESSDTWDTVDWLVKNIPDNNGKVGQWGISYPGFYSAAGAIDAHPALVAVSPQAPIADWWYDDFHHHGAFFLPHSFNFFYVFGPKRHHLTTAWGKRFKHGTPDGYRFFLEEMGGLANVNRYFYHDTIPFWNSVVAHPDYDDFWQRRNLIPHLNNIHPAMLTVGGWFDAEDLYGPLAIYPAIEARNPDAVNRIVMGPWRHGGWHRTDGTSLGHVWFGDNPAPSDFFVDSIEFPFFMHYLKGAPLKRAPEAWMFETGTNKWRTFDQWPPEAAVERILYLGGGQLQWVPPSLETDTFDQFISDPWHPVPYTEELTTGMTREYMSDDQRFASRRPDVLCYESDELDRDVCFAGKLKAHLEVSTSRQDADWVVKIIDIYPDTMKSYPHEPRRKIGGYQQMVRSEVIRGRYRNDPSRPEPFVPNEITTVEWPLQDVLHTFKKGHRIMVQIQSTWFPLVDRNPQQWVQNIYKAEDGDFKPAVHRVYHSPKHQSYITFGLLDR